MKWKNSAFFNKQCSFFEQEIFSARELVVICFLSLFIALWDKIFSLPSLAEWELTVEQDSILLSLSVLWQVITSVCLCLNPNYGDSLRHIVVFVGKKYPEIERNKPATG